jgi:hypothetical protein
MTWFSRLFRRAKADVELDEEIRFHLDQEARLRIDRGETPESARVSARRDFGNVLLVKETHAHGPAATSRTICLRRRQRRETRAAGRQAGIDRRLRRNPPSPRQR